MGDAHSGTTLTETWRPRRDRRGRRGERCCETLEEEIVSIPWALMGIPGGIPAAKDGRIPPRLVRSSGTQQRPYKLNTQVFFQLMQGVEEQNEDFFFFFISLQEIFILN